MKIYGAFAIRKKGKNGICSKLYQTREKAQCALNIHLDLIDETSSLNDWEIIRVKIETIEEGENEK